MSIFGQGGLPFAQPQAPQNPGNRIREYENFLKQRDPDSCLLLFSSKIAASPPMDSVLFITLISKILGKIRKNKCTNLWFHLTAFGGDIRTVYLLKKILDDLKFEEVRVIAPLRLGATASVTAIVIYDELYVNTNTIIDPFNITVQVNPQATMDLNTFLEVMDFLMKSSSKGMEVEDALKTQAYSLMLSSGALFGYVEALRERKFVEEIIESFIRSKLKIHEKEFEEIFLGTSDNIAIGTTGKSLKDLLNNVILMDEEDEELYRVSLAVEEEMQRFFEQVNANGVIATSSELITLAGSVMSMPS